MNMKNKYQTVYETSYGIVTAEFKEDMTYGDAEKKGKEYCKENNFKYLRTELVK